MLLFNCILYFILWYVLLTNISQVITCCCNDQFYSQRFNFTVLNMLSPRFKVGTGVKRVKDQTSSLYPFHLAWNALNQATWFSSTGCYNLDMLFLGRNSDIAPGNDDWLSFTRIISSKSMPKGSLRVRHYESECEQLTWWFLLHPGSSASLCPSSPCSLWSLPRCETPGPVGTLDLEPRN